MYDSLRERIAAHLAGIAAAPAYLTEPDGRACVTSGDAFVEVYSEKGCKYTKVIVDRQFRGVVLFRFEQVLREHGINRILSTVNRAYCILRALRKYTDVTVQLLGYRYEDVSLAYAGTREACLYFTLPDGRIANLFWCVPTEGKWLLNDLRTKLPADKHDMRPFLPENDGQYSRHLAAEIHKRLGGAVYTMVVPGSGIITPDGGGLVNVNDGNGCGVVIRAVNATGMEKTWFPPTGQEAAQKVVARVVTFMKEED